MYYNFWRKVKRHCGREQIQSHYNPGRSPSKSMLDIHCALFYAPTSINSDFVLDFKKSIKLLKKDKGVIQNKAKKLSKNIPKYTHNLYHKGFEGVAFDLDN